MLKVILKVDFPLGLDDDEPYSSVISYFSSAPEVLAEMVKYKSYNKRSLHLEFNEQDSLYDIKTIENRVKRLLERYDNRISVTKFVEF